MRSYKKKFRTHCLAPRCVVFDPKKRKLWIIYFYTVSLLKKLGTLCLGFLTWSFVFLVRLIAGWLKDSTLEVIAQKETSYENVWLGPFCGAFGKKGIVEFLKIAIILLILFGLCCNTTFWWSTNYTKQFCNYNLSMIFNNWKAIIFQFLRGRTLLSLVLRLIYFVIWIHMFLIKKKILYIWKVLNRYGLSYSEF